MPIKSLIKPLSVWLSLVSYSAIACDEIPREQTSQTNALVSRTKNIVLAQALKPQIAEDGLYSIEFEVNDVLKGDQWSNFILKGVPTKIDNLGNDYNKHTDLKFWAYSNAGNFFRKDDCTIYGTFERGRQYLIFLEQPYHTKSFELISSKDDDWLKEVTKNIAK